MPADTTFSTRALSFSALYFVINLETVMGVPEEISVKSNANTDSATW